MTFRIVVRVDNMPNLIGGTCLDWNAALDRRDEWARWFQEQTKWFVDIEIEPEPGP